MGGEYCVQCDRGYVGDSCEDTCHAKQYWSTDWGGGGASCEIYGFRHPPAIAAEKCIADQLCEFTPAGGAPSTPCGPRQCQSYCDATPKCAAVVWADNGDCGMLTAEQACPAPTHCRGRFALAQYNGLVIETLLKLIHKSLMMT